MTHIYLEAGAIISSLGVGKEAHLNALQKGKTGLTQVKGSGFNDEDWFLGKIDSLVENRYDDILRKTLLEFTQTPNAELLSLKETLVIVSSTKGNLDALPKDTFFSTREILINEFGVVNSPLIVSNACISGVIAVNTAADYLLTGKFQHVIVIGIDVLSNFIINGFQSLFALSNEPCRPFDKERKGISLGEACGIIVLSTKKSDHSVRYCGGASSNDANHISGPSRTGEGLVRAIQKTFERAEISAEEIQFISAHGTGTLYNDEMEAIAFERLGMSTIPVNSLKGYFGHTLGAAGVIEIIVCLLSMQHQVLFPSLGFSEQGTSAEMNIVESFSSTQVNTVLKTASGFGGGNAALILMNEA